VVCATSTSTPLSHFRSAVGRTTATRLGLAWLLLLLVLARRSGASTNRQS
jgi:hypothetical protein